MHRFDGTAARQLDLLDEGESLLPRRPQPEPRQPALRMLRKDVYAELARRRRRAQIAARHLVQSLAEEL